MLSLFYDIEEKKRFEVLPAAEHSWVEQFCVEDWMKTQ